MLGFLVMSLGSGGMYPAVCVGKGGPPLFFWGAGGGGTCNTASNGSTA